MASHAVLVCGPGLGHVNGCMLLAKALLECRTFSLVTLVCFSRSHDNLLRKGHFPAVSHPSVRLEVLSDGLPRQPISAYSDLFAITPTMHHSLLQLLQRLRGPPPTHDICLITDMIMAWSQAVADQMGIPRVEYWTASATSYLCLISLPQLISRDLACSFKGAAQPSGWKTKEKVELDCIPGLPGFPLEEVPRELRYAQSSADTMAEKFVIAAQNAKHAACVLIHSAHHLEPDAFYGLSQIGIRPYPIGPLLHQCDDATSGLLQSDDTHAINWLDTHATSSVIYVSFGSNAKLRESELLELALGLEASGHPFLWVVRSDATLEGRGLNQLLPADVFARIAQRSLIVPWASQRAILAHPAVGGFLSHCGWNSTMESLWMGVPILACPRAAEQPINCRFIVKDWGVGIDLQTNQDGTFLRQDVNVGVQTILVGEVGHAARKRAKQLSITLREATSEGGHSHSSLIKFASDIKRNFD